MYPAPNVSLFFILNKLQKLSIFANSSISDGTYAFDSTYCLIFPLLPMSYLMSSLKDSVKLIFNEILCYHMSLILSPLNTHQIIKWTEYILFVNRVIKYKSTATFHWLHQRSCINNCNTQFLFIIASRKYISLFVKQIYNFISQKLIKYHFKIECRNL